MQWGAQHKKTMRGGFTLLEIMLSLAFLSLMAVLPLLLGNFSLAGVNLANATRLTTASLESAHRFAIAEKAHGAWGVKVLPDTVTLFQGDTYASRNAAQDRRFPFAQDVAVTGLDEVVFASFTGNPSVTGTLTLSIDAQSHTLVLREHGFIDTPL